MRRIIYSMLMLVMALACAEFDEQSIVKVAADAPDMVYAAFDDEETRVYVESDKYLRWTAGDEISFFPVTNNVRYRYAGETGAKGGSFDKMTTGAVSGNALNNCYGVYPYRSATTITSAGVISFDMPAEQLYAENSFGLGANTMVAVTSSKTDNELRFKNVCGYLKLKLYGEDVVVKSVKIEGNNNEKIAGAANIRASYGGEPTVTMANNATESVTINCGDGVALGEAKTSATHFWFALPVTTFSKGFTITVTDTNGNEFTKSTSKSLAIERNIIQPMAEVEVVMVTAPKKPANNEIWYTTSDGKSLSLSGDKFGVTISSQEQRDGVWVVTFSSNLTMLGKDGSMYGAFESQKTLTSVVLPDGITKIGNYAFYKCSALQSVTLPASLQTIGTQSFVSTMLATITLPATVIAIENKAFDGSSLKAIYSLATTPPTLSNAYTFPSGVIAYVPDESIKRYEQHNYWGYLTIKALPDDMSGGDGAEGGAPDAGGSEGDDDNGSDDGVQDGDEGGSGEENEPEDEPVVTPTSGSEIWYTTTDGNAITLRTQCFNTSVASHEKRGDKWVITFNGTLTTIGVYNGSTGAFENSSTLKTMTLPNSVTAMYSYTFYECTNLQSVELSNTLQNIGEMSFYRCSLSEITLPATMKSIGGAAFYDCDKLSEVYSLATTPPTLGDDVVFPSGVTIYVPDSAIGAYLQNNFWNDYSIVTLSGEVTDDALMYAPNDPNYTSSDYSANGKYVALQTATEGKGIDIVLLGDGYSDRQIASGRYEADMRKAMEAFFSKEPYTSFRHLFNVYMVKCVSKCEGCTGSYNYGSTALNCYIKADGVSISGDNYVVYNYTREIFGEQSYTNNDGPRTDESTLIVIMNSDAYAGVCYLTSPKYNTSKNYGNGGALAYFSLCGNDDLFANLLIHEAAGHGFGKLGDEYFSSGNGAITNYYYYEMKDFEQWGWFKNVDATLSTALTSQTIKWKHFLSDSRYAGLVGIYEGAYSYAKNAYRPSDNSIMRHVKESDGNFNAPSREAIYYRIHKLAYGDSWTYNFEDFATWDAKNR